MGSRKLLWSTIIGLLSVVFIDLKINDNDICIFYVNNTFKIPTSKLSNEIFNSKKLPQEYLSEAICETTSVLPTLMNLFQSSCESQAQIQHNQRVKHDWELGTLVPLQY